MTNPDTEFDTPWKDILERYFEDFIRFFFPQAHREIDWNLGFEFLDIELQQVVRDAELGRRLVDKLVKIYRIGGEEAWVLIHVEVQSQQESDFAERMFVYHYRIYDRYKRLVASLAVLGDDSRQWRPNRFSYQLFGCEVNFQFPVVKLLDYEWESLEASSNPFATIVMAHLKAQQTGSDRQERKQWKLALTRRLYELQLRRQEVIDIFQFIDWVMSLPNELEQEFWQELDNYEEESRMPYITSVERIGIRKGIEQGIEQGIQQGIQQGIDRSREQMKQVLLESLELGLELKFGSLGLSLLPEISQIQNVEQLRLIQQGLKTVSTLEELRQIYQLSE